MGHPQRRGKVKACFIRRREGVTPLLCPRAEVFQGTIPAPKVSFTLVLGRFPALPEFSPTLKSCVTLTNGI